MFFENKTLDDAFTFIRTTPFDIFCLQEVPQAFLDRLSNLPYNLTYVSEVTLMTRTQIIPVYSVLLSKHPIVNTTKITFDYVNPTFGGRLVRACIDLTRKERVIAWKDRNAFSVEIEYNNERFQIFNIHLPLTYPKQRIKELIKILSSRKEGAKIIICGDFNTLEKFSITLLNWLMGGSFLDWVFYKRERHYIENFFNGFRIANPLVGTITHPISGSQLDHILVSHDISVSLAKVITKRYGSDHNPIVVKATL